MRYQYAMSVDELVFATHNPHKLKEIQQMLSDAFRVISLSTLGFHEDIEETGTTIEENSALKSRTIYEAFGKPVFADDSGLEVDALNGAPGVYSARYAGPEKDDESNWKKLLEALREVPGDRRGAQFKAVITLIMNGSETHQFTGIIRGQITEKPLGDGGFGYDPVFIPDGYDRTFAQMSEQDKNKISHRAVAVEKLVDYLSSLR